jgi:HmuY protein
MTKGKHLYTVNVSNTKAIVLMMTILVVLSGCFKKDITVVLPPKTGSSTMQVKMSSTYEKCYFINLDNASVVKESMIGEWDLRFDANANGKAVLMNAGNHSIRIIKTSSDNMKATLSIPSISETWGYDAPNQLTDSAYLNKWQDANGSSKNEVYIVRQGDGASKMKYFKIKMISADDNQYVMQYDTIDGINTKTISIPKSTTKNFSYFSFTKGGQVLDWEPAKKDWDICFMPYHQPFYLPTQFLYYPVVGCLANNFNTLSAGDTTKSFNFNTFTLADINQFTINSNVNNIGYNWKKPDNNFNFITYPDYLYLVKTQQGHLYKLHFLDFYYQGVEKGAPKFEFDRLQ